MYRRKHFVIGVCLFFISSSFRIWAQTNTSGQQVTKAITTAVPFLLITPDSRSGGLGEAGVALRNNVNATYWNVALLAFMEKKYGFGVNYTPWLRGLGIPDINLAYVPIYYSLGERGGVLGADMRFFSLGNIQFTDENGIETGQYNANEFAFGIGYTRKITDHFSAGTFIRYIQSNLANNVVIGGLQQGKPGRSVAGDIGIFYTKDFKLKSENTEVPMNISWGAHVSNIGAKMNYTDTQKRDFIPTNLRLGYVLTAYIDDYNKISLVNDFNKLLVPSVRDSLDEKTVLEGLFTSFGDAPGGFEEEISEINTSIGLEYWYNDLFAVRLGYFYEDPNKGDRKFLTFGVGLVLNVLTLDIAYLAPFKRNHPLQNTLRFSLSLQFE